MALQKLRIDGGEKATSEMLLGIAIFLFINFVHILLYRYGVELLPKRFAEVFSQSIPHIRSAVDFLKDTNNIPHQDAAQQAWTITHVLGFVWVSALLYWPLWIAWWIWRLGSVYQLNRPYRHPGSGYLSQESVVRRLIIACASCTLLAVYIVAIQLYDANNTFLYEAGRMTERLMWYVFLTGVTMLSLGLSLYFAIVIRILRQPNRL